MQNLIEKMSNQRVLLSVAYKGHHYKMMGGI